jgi:hypothetical protein
MLNIIMDDFTVCFPPLVLFSAHFSMTAFMSQWDDPCKENVFCFSMTVFGCTVWKLVNSNCWEILEHVLYSTALALSQYHLFSAPKDQLCGPDFTVVVR